MNTNEIEKILQYCDQATQGHWGRNLAEPKLITSNDAPDSTDDMDICHLASGAHKQDWKNYHFITNARRDLPLLAQYCMQLKQTLENTIKQFEPHRAMSRWTQLKKANRQLQLRKANQRLQDEMAKRRQELAQAKQQFEQEKTEHLQRFEETRELLESERVANQKQLHDITKQLHDQTQTAHAQQEMTRKRMDFMKKHPESQGSYTDILLDELSLIEADFGINTSQPTHHDNSPDNLARTATEFADTEDRTDRPVMTNEQLLGELDRLDTTITSITETSRQISNVADRLSSIAPSQDASAVLRHQRHQSADTVENAAGQFADSQQTTSTTAQTAKV